MIGGFTPHRLSAHTEIVYNCCMKNSLKTRFAPSPSGLMHFGNLRAALFNYLFAGHSGGHFLLRIEDTDAVRSEDKYREAIREDMEWLGLEINEGPFFQSERQTIYADYYSKLEASDRVYPCFCSDEQLALARKVQLASRQPPRYDGKCAALSKEEVAKRQAASELYTLRFRIPKQQKITFVDQVKGEQNFDTDHIGDFIIRRQDKSPSFMFCNAIDDVLMEVTHVLRGDDHLTNTPRQILILQALELPAPLYGHFPTIFGPDSRPLSKRNGSRSVQELRELGYFPLAIVNYLARLGHYDPDQNLLTFEQLRSHFELKNISQSPAHYDVAQLNHWQKEAMHRSSVEDCWKQIQPHLDNLVSAEESLDFVKLVQGNLVMPQDAVVYAQGLFANELQYSDEAIAVLKKTDESFFRTVLAQLEKMDKPVFSDLIEHLKQAGYKGKGLYQPLRVALMGTLHGPELDKIFNCMSHEVQLARLKQAMKQT